MLPEIGKYCWDVTVYKGNEDAEEPEEMIHSRVEIQEESLLKVTEGSDQMHIEDDVEGIEKEEYIIFGGGTGCADNRGGNGFAVTS